MLLMNHHYLVREIVLKYHRGEPLTAAEQAILDAELAHLPADKVWDRVRAHIETTREVRVIRPWYIRWPAITAGAAALVILVAGGLYRYQGHAKNTVGTLAMRTVAPGHYYQELQGPDGIEVIDSAAGRQSDPYPVTLPDGSRVTLSYGSSVRYVKAFEQRKVMLAGQAHFDVAKSSHPFTVESGKMTVQVLGTQFNWMHYPGVPDEITLLSGKIRLSRGNFQRELAPAERAVIKDGNPVLVNVQRMARPEEAVAWMSTRPTIKFDSTDFYIVIERMAQYYQVGYDVDSRLQNGRQVNYILDLRRSMEENLAPIREMLRADAKVEVRNGMIEVRLKEGTNRTT
jgi:ferric-dicitrate binding protein FerR (iron transport regulator)